jgi:hypothetical protein
LLCYFIISRKAFKSFPILTPSLPTYLFHFFTLHLSCQLTNFTSLLATLVVNYQVDSLFRQPPTASSPSRRLNPNWILPTAPQSEQPTRPDLASLKPEPTEQAQLLTKESNSMTAITVNPTILLATNDREASIPATTKAKPPSRVFIKFAAAVLLGTLILAPLAYYQLPHRSPASNQAAIIVDSPDITVEDSQKTPLTTEAIQEIEKLVKQLQLDKAQALLTPALQQAATQGDKATHSHLLYLQSRIFSEQANFPAAIDQLKQSIALAESLNQPRLLLAPTLLLTNIYEVTDQSAAATTQAQRCLNLAKATNRPDYQVRSLHALAINSYLAYKAAYAESLLLESITLAKQQNDDFMVAYGHTYLAIVKTKKKDFKAARAGFEQALKIANSINPPQQQNYLQFVIKGYYARCQALAANSKEAINLYQLAIQHANTAGVRQYLALSQLHYGLAQCFRAQGDTLQTERALAKAEVLEQEATKRCEVANIALSFAPIPKKIKSCN